MKINVRDLAVLQEIVIKSGYTYRGFGKELGLSGSYINQILNGKRNPSPPIAKKIAEKLNQEYDSIFFIKTGYKSEQTA